MRMIAMCPPVRGAWSPEPQRRRRYTHAGSCATGAAPTARPAPDALAAPTQHEQSRQQRDEHEHERRGGRVEPDEIGEGPAAAVEKPRADYVRTLEREVPRAHHDREPEALAA